MSLDCGESYHGSNSSPSSAMAVIVVTTFRADGLRRSVPRAYVSKLGDGVLLSTTEDGSASSHILTELKRRKKLLSKQLVLDMERCDALITFFQLLQE
jgi:hypothetical protein